MAFTTFLSSLNSGGYCAGQCDWRLPTRDELLTIVTPVLPACTQGPCIDPVFGLTVAYFHWSATTFADFPGDAWGVGSFGGYALFGSEGFAGYARAVRAGL